MLRALPADVFPVADRVEVKVGKTPYVRFDGNDYSVPHDRVRRSLTVVATSDTVRVMDGQDVIATHARSWDKGMQIEDAAHIAALVERKRKARDARGLNRVFVAAPVAQEFVRRLAERGGNIGNAVVRLGELLDAFGAVALAAPYVDQPVLIIFVDTIFDADLSITKTTDADGIIWTKEVEDYQRFGVVVTDADGHMTRIVEKPKEPISKRANIGLYYIRNWKLLFEGIKHVLTTAPNKGEWYLTDAFQYMIDHGAKIKVVDVEGWYDAGQLETLLDTNRTMLEKGRARRPATLGEGAEIVEPVYIEDGAVIEHATVGPNVSIGSGTRIRHATVRDAVIGEQSSISHANLFSTFLGDHVVVQGVDGSLNVGDHSEIRTANGGSV